MNIARIKLAVGTQIAAATKALHHPKLGDEEVHDARKQVKHLSQAVEILAGREPPKGAKKMLARADDVADWLGDDHDLAVVEEKLERFPAGAGKAKRRLNSHIEKRRERLQKKALKSAGKLFRKRTKKLVREVA